MWNTKCVKTTAIVKAAASIEQFLETLIYNSRWNFKGSTNMMIAQAFLKHNEKKWRLVEPATEFKKHGLIKTLSEPAIYLIKVY